MISLDWGLKINLAFYLDLVKIVRPLGKFGMLKNRILFVDDEPMILEALKRMLKKHAAEWEMAFYLGSSRSESGFQIDVVRSCR